MVTPEETKGEGLSENPLFNFSHSFFIAYHVKRNVVCAL